MAVVNVEGVYALQGQNKHFPLGAQVGSYGAAKTYVNQFFTRGMAKDAIFAEVMIWSVGGKTYWRRFKDGQWSNWSSRYSKLLRNPRPLVRNPYAKKFIPPGGKYVQYVYSPEDVAKRHAAKASRKRNPQGQTDTPEFKAWFGNSKVVDKGGKPRVLYHGTHADFTVFDTSGRRRGQSFGAMFTPSKAYAKNYGRKEYGGKVLAVYLRIEKPFDDKNKKHRQEWEDKRLPLEGWVQYAKRAGYDGAITMLNEYVVFDPNQIKSATDNRGTFDPHDPDIRHNPRRNPVRNPYVEKVLFPSGNWQYRYTQEDVAKRHAKKASRIESLKAKEAALRSAVVRDIKQGDVVALAVALILETYERPGNTASAKAGHYGVTGWECRHLDLKSNRAVIDYVAKSGVHQTKVITSAPVVRALAERRRTCRGQNTRLLPVSSSSVNRYLDSYDISAKDLRTFGANTEMQRELRAVRGAGPNLATLRPRDVAKTLKAEFNAALGVVAAKLGHTTSVLRKQYLVGGLEPLYLTTGTVLQSFTA